MTLLWVVWLMSRIYCEIQSPTLPCLGDRSEHCVHGLARHRLTSHGASGCNFARKRCHSRWESDTLRSLAARGCTHGLEIIQLRRFGGHGRCSWMSGGWHRGKPTGQPACQVQQIGFPHSTSTRRVTKSMTWKTTNDTPVLSCTQLHVLPQSPLETPRGRISFFPKTCGVESNRKRFAYATAASLATVKLDCGIVDAFVPNKKYHWNTEPPCKSCSFKRKKELVSALPAWRWGICLLLASNPRKKRVDLTTYLERLWLSSEITRLEQTLNEMHSASCVFCVFCDVFCAFRAFAPNMKQTFQCIPDVLWLLRLTTFVQPSSNSQREAMQDRGNFFGVCFSATAGLQSLPFFPS